MKSNVFISECGCETRACRASVTMPVKSEHVQHKDSGQGVCLALAWWWHVRMSVLKTVLHFNRESGQMGLGSSSSLAGWERRGIFFLVLGLYRKLVSFHCALGMCARSLLTRRRVVVESPCHFHLPFLVTHTKIWMQCLVNNRTLTSLLFFFLLCFFVISCDCTGKAYSK